MNRYRRSSFADRLSFPDRFEPPPMSFARRPAFFTPGSTPLPHSPESPAATSAPHVLHSFASRRQFLRQLSACSALATAALVAPTFADSPAASTNKAAGPTPVAMR